MKTIRIAIMVAAAYFALASCDQATTPKTDEPVKNADSSLSALTLSSGTLAPTFAANVTSYAASVPSATTSVTVTPTVSTSSSTIEVRVNSGAYATVASGSASSNLTLNTGANTINVRVTAQNGAQTTYTVALTRGQSSVSTLSALTLSPATLKREFAANVTSYASIVPLATTAITVTPTATASSATIEVRVNSGAYSTVTSGSASEPLALNVGVNTVDVRVTAQNGSTTTYSVAVTRAGTNMRLTLDFKYGTDGSSTYANIYVAWIEDMDGNVIQNLAVCNRLLGIGGGLTNTALPFWKVNKYNSTQVAVDAVTGPTVKKQDFTVTDILKDSSVTKFKICFETDRSFDANDWFGDQPALLYSAVVDLDDLQPSYALTLEAWTPNEGTINTLFDYLGTLLSGSRQFVMDFITHKKAASTPPAYAFGAVDTTRSSTCFVESITLKVE